MNYEFASAEDIGDRKEQQDRVALASHPKHDDVVIAVLADGMGGHKGGALASQAVLDAVLPMFDAFVPGAGQVRDWLGGMTAAAHQKVAATGRGNNRDPRSTCVIALAQKDRIDWVHCGDSRLYVFRNGEYFRRTEDHSLVEILVKQGEIREEEALLHPDRSKLFTSLGGPEMPQLAFGALESVEAGDTILMASDGLWTYFRNRELAVLTSYRGLSDACDRLVTLARRRAAGNGDNLSVGMLRCVGPARRSLLGALFNSGARQVEACPLEDCRRFLLSYLRDIPGAAPRAIAQGIENCATPDQLRELIRNSAEFFASMTNKSKARAFTARALDLLD
jgi:serine/threonine protein phosphatase PrpC